MNDLPHLASRLYGTPLLVARAKLETILGVFERKLAGQPLAFADDDDTEPRWRVDITEDGIAVIPILGTLVRRSSYLAAASGLTSYHAIEEMAEEAFTHPDTRAVLLEIDSSGGEAGGVFDLSERLRDMSQATGKPLWAIADENALSAAYALAVSADQIWLPRSAEVGSIGVVAVHVDQSEADKADGLKYTYIHAGARKIDGNPHEPLPEPVAADIQRDIDALYGDFCALVASRRGLADKAVRGTEARSYRGQDAIKAGLADKIGTRAQALAALSASLSAKRTRLISTSSPAMAAESIVHPEASMSDETQVAETRPKTEQSKPQAAAPAPADREAITAEVAAAMRAELTELAQIAAQAARLGVTIDPAQAHGEGLTPAALRKRVLDMAASADQARDIQANTPHPDAGAKRESPLLAATQKLVDQS